MLLFSSFPFCLLDLGLQKLKKKKKGRVQKKYNASGYLISSPFCVPEALSTLHGSCSSPSHQWPQGASTVSLVRMGKMKLQRR